MAGNVPSTAMSTSSRTFNVPNSAEYGLIPWSVCLSLAVPVIWPSSACSSNDSGALRPSSSSSPLIVIGPPFGLGVTEL